MLDLNKLMNNALVKLEEEKTVEGILEKHLVKCIDDVIGDLFRWSGPFKKQLEEVVQNKLELNLDALDMASYSQIISGIVAEKLDTAIHIHGVEKVKAEMDEMLKKCKDEYKLSEIIDLLKKEAKGYQEDWEIDEDEQVSLHIDARSTLTFITFDEDGGKSEYSCKYSLTLRSEDNSIQSIEIDGESDKKLHLGKAVDLSALLFRMYASGAKVVLDEGTDEDYYDLQIKEDCY